MSMTESPTVRRINDQVPDTLAHYLAEEQQARFHTEALALLEAAKPFVGRCNSIGGQFTNSCIEYHWCESCEACLTDKEQTP